MEFTTTNLLFLNYTYFPSNLRRKKTLASLQLTMSKQHYLHKTLNILDILENIKCELFLSYQSNE